MLRMSAPTFSCHNRRSNSMASLRPWRQGSGIRDGRLSDASGWDLFLPGRRFWQSNLAARCGRILGNMSTNERARCPGAVPVGCRRGVTCFSCHDVHRTDNYAQLRKPGDQLCLDCHGPLSLNGPRTGTIEEHTHHKEGSAGSSCIACHMPQIETTIADVKVRAHTFAFITPAMTDKY